MYNDIFTQADISSNLYDRQALNFAVRRSSRKAIDWEGKQPALSSAKRPILVLSFSAKRGAGPRTNSELGDIIRCEKPHKMVHLMY